MINLGYQFFIKVRGLEVPTETMPYEIALGLSDKLNKQGIHYTITETDTRCGNYRQLTSRMLHILSKNQR